MPSSLPIVAKGSDLANYGLPSMTKAMWRDLSKESDDVFTVLEGKPDKAQREKLHPDTDLE